MWISPRAPCYTEHGRGRARVRVRPGADGPGARRTVGGQMHPRLAREAAPAEGDSDTPGARTMAQDQTANRTEHGQQHRPSAGPAGRGRGKLSLSAAYA